MRRPEFIARQGAHPRGFLGRLIARIMSVETAAENRAALDLLDLQAADRVLEIGSGHGRSLQDAARRVPRGLVVGVDVSEDMVEMARRRCAADRDLGAVEVHLADGVRLPFPAGHFDKAFSVHTLYFWRQPQATLKDIGRVMRAGGTLVLGFRTKDDHAAAFFPQSVYCFYSLEDVRTLVETAGFKCDQERRVQCSGSDLVLLRARLP